MFIGASEGHAFRYEIIEDSEGFLVRMRDLATGEVEEDETRMYRTAAVAFAYAELSAAFDRYAAARVNRDESAQILLIELTSQQALYQDLSRRLGDDGLAAQVLAAWTEQATAQDRRRLH